MPWKETHGLAPEGFGDEDAALVPPDHAFFLHAAYDHGGGIVDFGNVARVGAW